MYVIFFLPRQNITPSCHIPIPILRMDMHACLCSYTSTNQEPIYEKLITWVGNDLISSFLKPLRKMDLFFSHFLKKNLFREIIVIRLKNYPYQFKLIPTLQRPTFHSFPHFHYMKIPDFSIHWLSVPYISTFHVISSL